MNRKVVVCWGSLGAALRSGRRLAWHSSRSHSKSTGNIRSLFELYQQNPSWMGQSTLPKPATERSTAEVLVDLEQERLKLGRLPVAVDPSTAVWTPSSVRVGAIGLKLGMTCMWTAEGKQCAVSVIHIKDCQVIDTQLSREDGGDDEVTQMILGAVDQDEEGLSKMSRAHFEWYHKRNLFPKKKWSGFPCSVDALLLPGTQINASHFMPGQRVRVKGITIDHGFQGVMKRWGMKGQPRSHGQTKTHRKMGGSGGGGDPGRVFPGKRMPGHMGGDYHTTPPVRILRINTKFNILFVHGSVPGEVGGFLKIVDFYNQFPATPPPFPTKLTVDETPVADELYADGIFCFHKPSIVFSSSE